MAMYQRAEESVGQDCLVCLAHARGAMEALNEIDKIVKQLPMSMSQRGEILKRTKGAWWALHLRKSCCHGQHAVEA